MQFLNWAGVHCHGDPLGAFDLYDRLLTVNDLRGVAKALMQSIGTVEPLAGSQVVIGPGSSDGLAGGVWGGISGALGFFGFDSLRM